MSRRVEASNSNFPEPTIERVFSLYGRASFSLHLFEVGILTIRVLLHATEEKKRVIRGRPPKNHSLDKATCGDLLKQIESKWTLPDDFRQHLTAYVSTRNYLVHQFFRKRNLDLLSWTARSEMIAELAIHIACFEASLHLVDTLRKQLCKNLNWPEQELTQEFERWLRVQLKSDADKYPHKNQAI